VRKPGRAARGSPAPHAATRRKGQRNWHRLVPASSGAKASLACEERQLVRVCPRVDIGCRSRRTTLRFRETRSRWQTGAWTGTRLPRRSARTPRGSKASTTGTAVAKPRSRERPEPGVRKDVAGQRFSSDGRHPRSFLGWLVHASRLKAALAALEMIRERANGHAIEGEATGVSEARSARITTGRQRPSR
jgi:hypothetical protein